MDYTYEGWKKVRPLLLKSTGLGDVLKKYEAAKKELAKAEMGTILELFDKAYKAFEEVEKNRTEAIKSCGSTFAEAKKYLEQAKPEQEALRLGEAGKKFFEGATKSIEERFKEQYGKQTLAIKLCGESEAKAKKLTTICEQLASKRDEHKDKPEQVKAIDQKITELKKEISKEEGRYSIEYQHLLNGEYYVIGNGELNLIKKLSSIAGKLAKCGLQDVVTKFQNATVNAFKRTSENTEKIRKFQEKM